MPALSPAAAALLRLIISGGVEPADAVLQVARAHDLSGAALVNVICEVGIQSVAPRSWS
jgi:hypothetical protein